MFFTNLYTRHVMKSFLCLICACAMFATTARTQDETGYRICTEIILDAVDNDDTPTLPPGMVAKAVGFKPELGKYWKNGRTLKVRFLDGSEVMRSRVRKYASEWSTVANIQFLFVEKGESDLRVSFTHGLGTWSVIGTDASSVPQYKQTINFGWFRALTTEREYRATILHEFGHALGLLHEHQHPQGGIPWNKPELYRFYEKTQGWDKALVDQQVLGRYSSDKTQFSKYDPHSIMHYPIPNSLTVGDFEVGMNMDMSPTDQAFIGKLYPKKASSTATTEPYASTATRPNTGGATTSTTRPNTSGARPPRPNPSVATTATLTIRDVLPESQKREQVWVTIQGITRTFVLDQSGARAANLSFTLPKDGRYSYEIRTKTTFVRRVNGRTYETVSNGYGEGELLMRRDAAFDLVIGKNINDRWFQVDLRSATTKTR